MEARFQEVDIREVAQRLYDEDKFDLYFFEDEGFLKQLSSFKDFTRCVAENLTIYMQFK